MPDNVLRIAICQSPPTLWQAHYIKDKLMANRPGLIAELIPIVTRGDVILDTPLAKVGGKGLFVKELEVALLENRASIVVHSMKDVPAEFPQGLGLVTICECRDPCDVLVSNTYDGPDALPAGGIVGTSNLRRRCQLAERRPDLIIHSLYGNAGTRLSKLSNGEYDAIILAVAGLKRLGLESRIRAALPFEISLPVVGQGAVGIECRLNDACTRELLTVLNHHETTLRVIAERVMNTRFESGCQAPISSCIKPVNSEIWLRALVGASDGSQTIRGERRGAPQDTGQMGISLAEELLGSGARETLTEVYNGGAPA